jgi:hypothetical protein
LLIVLVLGGPWIVALIAIAVGLAGIEVFRLLGQAGYPSIPLLGIALAIGVVVDGAIPTNLDGSGLILVAIGTILAAVGSFAKRDPRDGLPTWFATVFGALYVSLLGLWSGSASRRPEPPTSAPLAFLGGSAADPAPRPWACGPRHPARTSSAKRFGRAKFLTHSRRRRPTPGSSADWPPRRSS